MLRLALLAAALIFAVPAVADVRPARTLLSGGCAEYVLCSAEADGTAGCDNNAATPDNIVADVTGTARITFYATDSTASSFTCNAYTSADSYSSTKRAAITASALGTQITESTQVVSVEGAMRFVWIECAAPVGGTVTIEALACGVK